MRVTAVITAALARRLSVRRGRPEVHVVMAPDDNAVLAGLRDRADAMVRARRLTVISLTAGRTRRVDHLGDFGAGPTYVGRWFFYIRARRLDLADLEVYEATPEEALATFASRLPGST